MKPYHPELPGIGRPPPEPKAKPLTEPQPSHGINNPAVRNLCLSFFTGMSRPATYLGMRKLERCLDRMEMKYGC